MLRQVSSLHGASIRALDGNLGKIDEILFDDEHWTIRYVAVDTGGWLSGRKVLISMLAFGSPDWDSTIFNLNLTRQQIENSPGLDSDQPVSRQWEKRYFDMYSWPYYWGSVGWWGDARFPNMISAVPIMESDEIDSVAKEPEEQHASEHLRSSQEVLGYQIMALDGKIGHIDDLILDEANWRIKYIAVDTRDYWPGKKVLLPPYWIRAIRWPEKTVSVEVTQEQVKGAPSWDESVTIDADFEEQLHRYYGKQWPLDRELVNT